MNKYNITFDNDNQGIIVYTHSSFNVEDFKLYTLTTNNVVLIEYINPEGKITNIKSYYTELNNIIINETY